MRCKKIEKDQYNLVKIDSILEPHKISYLNAVKCPFNLQNIFVNVKYHKQILVGPRRLDGLGYWAMIDSKENNINNRNQETRIR